MAGRPREFDRDQALDRAMHVFWEHGYDGTAISQLVDEIGIGRQSLYSTFGDKRQLFDEALTHYAETELRNMISILEAPGSPLENLLHLLAMKREMVLANNHCGCLLGKSCAEFGGYDEVLATRLAGYLRRIEDAFADSLQRAQEVGEIGPERDPRALARLLVNTGQGLSVVMPVRKDPAFINDVFKSVFELLN